MPVLPNWLQFSKYACLENRLEMLMPSLYLSIMNRCSLTISKFNWWALLVIARNFLRSSVWSWCLPSELPVRSTQLAQNVSCIRNAPKLLMAARVPRTMLQELTTPRTPTLRWRNMGRKRRNKTRGSFALFTLGKTDTRLQAMFPPQSTLRAVVSAHSYRRLVTVLHPSSLLDINTDKLLYNIICCFHN